MPSPSPAYTPLPSSAGHSRAFDEALFRSTLGSPPSSSKVPSPPPRYETVLPPAPAGQIYLTLETVLESDEEEEGGAEGMDEGMGLRDLEKGLYGYSFASLLLTLLYFFSPSLSITPLSAFLPPTPLLALAAYVVLLLTFRTGVRRIALAVDEPRSLEEEEIGRRVGGQEGRLEGGRGVGVQGLTLLASAALMHLPVHALKNSPLGIGFAAWCCSTCLVGLMMWDAVNRASAEHEREENEMESAGLTWVGGYITKA
ncbi:hypothetical protein BCR35DRAFT_334254 [Leucosporidium creatinivorum]|uniref:Uncharacterized protein n=1 Tax=Leucosporidium creatinivorum TaxID=106004 RepID=A0A1Y2ECX3_9BASI|nr:hypothetical protein BCR35DRAFT_334254 [Leucosporidium creatinivorum]